MPSSKNCIALCASAGWTFWTSRATSSAIRLRERTRRSRRCTSRFGVTFPQFAKIEVNGEGADPLFAYLQEQKGFEGFDRGHELTPVLEDLLAKADPGYAQKPSIKWNFTKFLVDRDGSVVRRFEPTASIPDVVAPAAEELL